MTIIRRIVALFRRKPAPDLRVTIARRAQRVCNRKPAAARLYEAKHAILAEGVRK